MFKSNAPKILPKLSFLYHVKLFVHSGLSNVLAMQCVLNIFWFLGMISKTQIPRGTLDYISFRLISLWLKFLKKKKNGYGKNKGFHTLTEIVRVHVKDTFIYKFNSYKLLYSHLMS